MYKHASLNAQRRRESIPSSVVASANQEPEALTLGQRKDALLAALTACERELIALPVGSVGRKELGRRRFMLQTEMQALKAEARAANPYTPAPKRNYLKDAIREVLSPYQAKAVFARAKQLANEAKAEDDVLPPSLQCAPPHPEEPIAR